MRCLVRALSILMPAMLAGKLMAADADRYMIEMELWIEGELRASPMVVVEGGEPAEISSLEADGQPGWKIELEVEPPGAGEGAPDGAIWLHLSIHQHEDGEWVHLADSLLGVPEGRANSLSVLQGDGAATAEDSLVYLVARTSRMRPDS